MKKNNKYARVYVDPAFKRKICKEAIDKNTDVIGYTKKLGEDSRTLEEIWSNNKKKKNRGFDIGL